MRVKINVGVMVGITVYIGIRARLALASSSMKPKAAVVRTATTQKVHWNSSSIVTLWKSKLLSASLFRRIMLADATQYAAPGSTCGGQLTKRFKGGVLCRFHPNATHCDAAFSVTSAVALGSVKEDRGRRRVRSIVDLDAQKRSDALAGVQAGVRARFHVSAASEVLRVQNVYSSTMRRAGPGTSHGINASTKGYSLNAEGAPYGGGLP